MSTERFLKTPYMDIFSLPKEFLNQSYQIWNQANHHLPSIAGPQEDHHPSPLPCTLSVWCCWNGGVNISLAIPETLTNVHAAIQSKPDSFAFSLISSVQMQQKFHLFLPELHSTRISLQNIHSPCQPEFLAWEVAMFSRCKWENLALFPLLK